MITPLVIDTRDIFALELNNLFRHADSMVFAKSQRKNEETNFEEKKFEKFSRSRFFLFVSGSEKLLSRNSEIQYFRGLI